MEAEILAWGRFNETCGVALSVFLIIISLIIMYRSLHLGMAEPFIGAFLLAIVSAYVLLLSSTELYKINNYPMVYLADKMKSNQCK